VGFGLCFWQNHEVFDILNAPLPDGRQPLTFGVTEPFLTTMTISAYAGFALALPVILYELYAFVLPAFSPQERRVALPILLMVPVLFAAGIAFGYFVVLDRAVDFLLSFNQSEFNIQVRARDYYSFVAMMLLAMGLVFQVPLAILAVTRIGIVTPQQLREWRRYAYFICVVVAALLPTVDPVSMVLETVPLIVLFELSIVLASVLGGSGRQHAPPEPSAEGSP
jgi:sec-independent protein translocase protein TatC